MYEISKEFHFSASHQLNGLPEGHPCGRNHGHNYVVTVTLQSAGLTGPGWVKDFRDLEPFKKWIDENLDHQLINETCPEMGEPTSENMASWLFGIAAATLGVRREPGHATWTIAHVKVSETPKTWAVYRP